MCTEITYGTGICGFRAIVDAYCDFDFRATPDRHLCGPKLSARLPVYGIGSFCLLHAQICEGTAFVCHAENYFFLKRIIGTPAAQDFFWLPKHFQCWISPGTTTRTYAKPEYVQESVWRLVHYLHGGTAGVQDVNACSQTENVASFWRSLVIQATIRGFVR